MKKLHFVLVMLFVTKLTFAESSSAEFFGSNSNEIALTEDITFDLQITNGNQFYDGAVVDFQMDVSNTGTTPVTNGYIGFVFNTTIFDHLSINTSYPFVNTSLSNIGLFLFNDIDLPAGGSTTISFSLSINYGAPLGVVNNVAGFICLLDQYVDNTSFEIITCADLACPTDLTGDGYINGSDLLLFLGAYNSPCNPGECCPEDFNGDGFVNTMDLVTILGTLGTPCDAFNAPNYEKRNVEYTKEFTYSPNPVADKVEFRFTTYPYQTCYLAIYSAKGELIQRYEDLKDGYLEIDMSKLNSGLYLVHFFNGIELEVTKLVKE